jgi:hypothetical protein
VGRNVTVRDGPTERRHCKKKKKKKKKSEEASQEVRGSIAKKHRKEASQGGIAERHCNVVRGRSQKVTDVYEDTLMRRFTIGECVR